MALSKVAALTGILLSSYGRVMDELVRKQTNGPLINLTVTTDGIEKSDIAGIDKNFDCVFAVVDLFEGHVPSTNQIMQAVRGCDVHHDRKLTNFKHRSNRNAYYKYEAEKLHSVLSHAHRICIRTKKGQLKSPKESILKGLFRKHRPELSDSEI